MALLGAAKAGGSLFSESNLLYVALIFYAGAGALYMGFGVTGTARYVKFASTATAIGLVANTLAVAHRWYLSGRPPFASIYEMLLSFVWAVALLTLVAEKKFGVKIIGSITMPLAVVCVILMQLLPSEVRPLVPALQSTWLHVHVTLAMLAYAACALSFALAMMFLIQDDLQDRNLSRLDQRDGQRDLCCHCRYALREVGRPVGHRMGRRAPSPTCSWAGACGCSSPFLTWAGSSLWQRLAAIVPLALYFAGRVKKDESFFGIANKAVFIGILLQIVVLAAFVLRVRDASYPSPDQDGLFPTSLAASPFLLGGMVTGIFASLLVPDAAVAARRPARHAAVRRHPRSRHLQDDLYRFPAADRHDRHRRVLGQPHLGFVLELGPEGDLGRDHLAGLCGLFAYADHARMARTQGRVLRHSGFRRRDLHLPRRHVSASRLTRVRMRNPGLSAADLRIRLGPKESAPIRSALD